MSTTLVLRDAIAQHAVSCNPLRETHRGAFYHHATGIVVFENEKTDPRGIKTVKRFLRIHGYKPGRIHQTENSFFFTVVSDCPPPEELEKLNKFVWSNAPQHKASDFAAAQEVLSKLNIEESVFVVRNGRGLRNGCGCPRCARTVSKFPVMG